MTISRAGPGALNKASVFYVMPPRSAPGSLATLMNKTLRSFLLSLAGLQIVPDKARVVILRVLGWKIGENTAICHGVFASASDVSIGANVYIGPYSYFDSHGGVDIGSSVRIGSHFKILTRSHPIADGSIRAVLGDDIDLRTSIGSGSWIAANVTVLPGASVAESCVIGAGAVVTKPTEVGGKYLGVPAKRVI